MADEPNPDEGNDDASKALAALTKKNAELLGEAKKAKDRARELEAAEADRAAKLVEIEEEAARKSKDIEKLEAGWKDKHSKAEGDVSLWKTRYESLVIDGGLAKELEAAKVNPALREAAAAMLKARHDVQLDEKGNASIDGKALSDFVGEFAKSDIGKAFIANGSSGGGSNGSGNGSGGSGDANPWDPKSRNLTEQGRLVRADLTKARQMAAQHGVKL